MMGGKLKLKTEAFSVSIPGLPQLSVPPVTVAVGSTAMIQCQILANPPVSNTMWFYEQGGLRRTITTGGRFIISPSSNTLTILNAVESDSGYYICSAQNVFGTNSTSGRLTVEGKYC